MSPIILAPFVAPAAGVIALAVLLSVTIRTVAALSPGQGDDQPVPE